VTHQPANDWSNREADPKCRADQPHSLRTIFRRGDVRNVSLRSRYVSARDSIDYPGDEQQEKRVRETHQQEPECGSDHTEEQNRPPSNSIRKVSEKRSEDELHHRVNRHEDADRGLRSAELAGIERQMPNPIRSMTMVMKMMMRGERLFPISRARVLSTMKLSETLQKT
jgi:hypothetical protein